MTVARRDIAGLYGKQLAPTNIFAAMMWPNNTINMGATNPTRRTYRTRHTARADATFLSVGIGAFYSKAASTYLDATMGDQLLGNDLWCKVAFEDPANAGVIVPAYYAKSASAKQIVNGYIEETDPTYFPVKKGQDYWVRILYETHGADGAGTGNAFIPIGKATNGSDNAEGEAWVTSDVAHSGSIGTFAGSSNFPSPLYVKGQVSGDFAGNVIIISNSRDRGTNDSLVNGGRCTRACIARERAYMQMAVSAQGAKHWLTSFFAYRAQGALYGDTYLIGDPVNDLLPAPTGGAASLATIQGYSADLWRLAWGNGAKEVIQLSCDPIATSVKGHINTGDQTATAANEAVRLAWNDWAASQVGQVGGPSKFIDFRTIACHPNNRSWWIVNGQPNYACSDGLHESEAITILEAAYLAPSIP